MRSTVRKLVFLSGLLCLLSGCMFKSVDELYAIPRVTEDYQNLQAAINGVIGSGSAISPLSGTNTQTIQLVDMDKDGENEAIAFFRDNTAERPLQIAIFKKLGEDYIHYATIEGAASDIESIEYVDMFGDDKLEILVSWQVTPTIHTLIAYSIFDDQVDELMRSNYTRYLTFDINGDGKMEVFLIQTDASNPSVNQVELYVAAEEKMELHSAAPISEGINASAAPTMEAGRLVGDVPALFVTFDYGENQYTTDVVNHITDVFSYRGERLVNVTYNEEDRRSSDTLRIYTGVMPKDMDGDGVWEIPSPKSFPSYEPATGAENFWKITWKQYDIEGNAYPVLKTYHNISDKWHLELPEHWDDVVTLSRPENKSIGERAVEFSYWEGDPGIEPIPFLRVYRLSGNNKYVNAYQEGRYLLADDNETVYVVEFIPDSWDCGLDEESFSKLFWPVV